MYEKASKGMTNLCRKENDLSASRNDEIQLRYNIPIVSLLVKSVTLPSSLLSIGTFILSTMRSVKSIPALSTPCHPSSYCSLMPTCCGVSLLVYSPESI